jgi:hypothetical protein
MGPAARFQRIGADRRKSWLLRCGDGSPRPYAKLEYLR